MTFSNTLYRLSLLAMLLSGKSVIGIPGTVSLGKMDGLMAGSFGDNFVPAPMKFLRTPVTKRSYNRTRTDRVTRTLPVLDALLPISANVKVDICIDLSVRLLGIVNINLFAVASLQALINQKGISVQELAIVQASVVSQLAASARAATTSWECQQKCTSATCKSQTWDQSSKTCTLVPKQLTTKSSILANLIAQLGPSDPEYCQLCPNRCNSAPSASARIVKRSASLAHCPTGLSACPIDSLSPSYGFECLNVQQELDSCGGCASTGEGVNCNKLPGFKRAGCNSGQCLAFECEVGYSLTPANTCILIV